MRILAVTRMFERKGIQHLLRALAEMDNPIETNIVGDGPYLNHLKEMAQDLKLDVRFWVIHLSQSP